MSGSEYAPPSGSVPSITEMVQALTAAGWKQKHSTVWQAPDGRLYRGPALAYHMMAGLPWPPNINEEDPTHKISMERARESNRQFCVKCGQRFEAHNSDGSCVKEPYGRGT